MPITFRPAEEKDTALLLKFIRALAEYEHMLDQVVADEKTLADWLAAKHVTLGVHVFSLGLHRR